MRAASIMSLTILTALVTSSCTVSDRDRYSYDGVDDETAQALYLQDQAMLRDRRALKGQEWEVFVLGTTRRICKSLEQGVPFDDLVEFVSENVAVTNARQFVGNAAGYACPQALN